MKKIFLAGHQGMVGRAIHKQLKQDNSVKIITANRNDLNLINQADVMNFFERNSPDEVIIAAAKVGGIKANNDFPAEFIYENLQIQNNIIHQSHLSDVQKLLFLGSSCIYPAITNQPINENQLLTGQLEETNEPYAIAKIAGIKMCESYNRQYSRDYRSVMPTNLFGPGDNYHPENSHVLPALIDRFHKAKIAGENIVYVWGSGKPLREFLFVDDMAKACIHIHKLEMEKYREITDLSVSHLNIGSGMDISIRALAYLVQKTVGFKGEIHFDNTKPDGTFRKTLNVNKINALGWFSTTSLEDGITKTYEDYIKNYSSLRR